MNLIDKLLEARAWYAGLLDIAAKRTPGKWGIHGMSVHAAVNGSFEARETKRVCSTECVDGEGKPNISNALFIAACAGLAERGWMNAIATIDWLLAELQHGWDGTEEPDHPFGPQLRLLAGKILEEGQTGGQPDAIADLKRDPDAAQGLAKMWQRKCEDITKELNERLRDFSASHLAASARDLEKRRELERENEKLRGLLGNSALPCTYCGLPADRQAECRYGFPGCPRGDDQMLSQHFADGYKAECCEKENAHLRERLSVATEALEEIHALYDPNDSNPLSVENQANDAHEISGAALDKLGGDA